MNSETPAKETIQFRNNKGEIINFSEDLTINDLVKLGVIQIRLVLPDEPIEDGEWRSLEILKGE